MYYKVYLNVQGVALKLLPYDIFEITRDRYILLDHCCLLFRANG